MAITIHKPGMQALTAAFLAQANAGGNISITGLLNTLGFVLPSDVAALIAQRDAIIRNGNNFSNSGPKIDSEVVFNGEKYKLKVSPSVGGTVSTAPAKCTIQFVDTDQTDLIRLEKKVFGMWFGVSLLGVTVEPGNVFVKVDKDQYDIIIVP